MNKKGQVPRLMIFVCNSTVHEASSAHKIVIVLCFVVRYCMSILVLQSS